MRVSVIGLVGFGLCVMQRRAAAKPTAWHIQPHEKEGQGEEMHGRDGNA